MNIQAMMGQFGDNMGMQQEEELSEEGNMENAKYTHEVFI
jgi:hypothetical protein